MNYTDLQQRILDDTHKNQYAGEPVQRFIAQGEALIAAHLESYNFLAQLTDANRTGVGLPTYTLPVGLDQLRYVRINGYPLDKVDETSVYLQREASQPRVYVQRIGQIQIAGNPGLTTTIDIDYMGMPAPLASVATNTLLDKAPQLYIDAASVYVFRRAQDYDSAEIALQSLVSLCAGLNRKMKKLLGGANSAGPYNVTHRSAY